MRKWTTRLRAAAAVGMAWAAAWFGAGMLLLLVVGPDAADVPFPLFFGLLGFLAGTAFAGLLSAFAGKRRFDQMSVPRFATWGAVGGLILAAGVRVVAGPDAELLALGPIFAAAGAVSASGTLALARRATAGELPDGRMDALESEREPLRDRRLR